MKPVAIDAAVAATDWIGACEIALRAAPKASANRRASGILEGCLPCNGLAWKPILEWNTVQTEGGPTRAAIEAVMAACGYCDPNGKQRFLGTLDDARGTPSRAPWRTYGEVCNYPDNRYASAPYFALDTIARAAGKQPTLAPLLAAFELELPLLSPNGVGPTLPTAQTVQPRVGPVYVYVSAGPQLSIGMLPRATMTAAGLTVDDGGAKSFPGEPIAIDKLDEAVGKLQASAKPFLDDPDRKYEWSNAVAVIAPSGLPATIVLPVIATLAKRKVVIAVEAHGAPTGWTLAGAVPVLLDTEVDSTGTVLAVAASVPTLVAATKDTAIVGKPTIQIDAKSSTVTHLAGAIGVASFKGASRAAVVAK